MIVTVSDYDRFFIDKSSHVTIVDHMGGFDQNYQSLVLDRLQSMSHGQKINVKTEYIFNDLVGEKYHNLNFAFDLDLWTKGNYIKDFLSYNVHPALNLQNFICSFNGSPHVSRKLLVSIINKFGWFDTKYCSKNFIYTPEVVDGHVKDYVQENQQYYQKFFSNGQEFCQRQNSFDYSKANHKKNVEVLSGKLTQSFLHLVSETMATSYYPFVTEKFLYSVVTRGLFVSYAQPSWHSHLENFYGFKKYDKIFDYKFDTVKNPIMRLIELMSMIAKFSILSHDDWHDLYEIEKDTIEHNYDWYFSKSYLKKLEIS